MNRKEMLLTIAAEECSEIALAISKTLRFGPDEVYEPIGISNSGRVVNELNDLLAVIEMLVDEGVLRSDIFVPNQIRDKKLKVEKYLNYSKELGTLT